MRKKTIISVLIVCVGLFVLLTIVATAHLVNNIDQYKQGAITRIEDATGRKLVVGEAEVAMSLSPEFIVRDVSFSNAEWGTRPQMIKAGSLKVRIGLLSLFLGDFTIEEIILFEPDIYLETNSQGLGNWNLSKKTVEKSEHIPPQQNADSIPKVRLQQIGIEGGKLHFRNGATEHTITVSIEHYSTKPADLGSLATLDLDAVYLGHAIKARGKMGQLHTILRNEPYLCDLNIETSDIQIHIDGEITRPLDFQGVLLDLNVKAETASNFSWITGSELSSQSPLDISGRLIDQKAGYRFEDFRGNLGESNLAGFFELIVSGTKPKVVAQLTSTQIGPEAFNMEATAETGQDLTVESRKEVEQGPSALIFSDEPLPFDILKDIDADISLSAMQLTFDSMLVQKLDIKLLLENGFLTLKPIQIEIADGSITADLIIDRTAEVPKISSSIHASEIEMGKLINSLTNNDTMTGGKADIDIEISGQGNSLRKLMAGLNGKVFLSVTGAGQASYDRAKIDSDLVFDLLNQMNPLAEKDKASRLECVVLDFDINDGIAITDEGLAFESDKLKFLGTGTIDLKTEQVKLLLNSKSTVTKLMQVEGSLSELKFGLNRTGLLNEVTSIGAALTTGGFSILGEGLLDWISDEESPCERVQQKRSQQKVEAGS